MAYAFSKYLKIPKRTALSSIRSSILPARMQLISKSPKIMIDSAHNPVSISALCREIRIFPHKKLIVLFGAMKDKNYPKELKTLSKISHILICTQVSTPRSESHKILQKEAKKHFPCAVSFKNPKKALFFAKKIANKNDLILITGSIYLIGEIFGKEKRIIPM